MPMCGEAAEDLTEVMDRLGISIEDIVVRPPKTMMYDTFRRHNDVDDELRQFVFTLDKEEV